MTYQKGEATEIVGEAIQEAAAIGIAYSGVKAYQNHYDRTGDRGDAVYQGALTARRWWVWYMFTFCGVIMTMVMGWGLLWIHYIMPRFGMTNYSPETGQNSYAVAAVAAYAYDWLVLGVIYCRNIDSGLYKRRWVYRRLRGLYALTQRIPSLWLYLSIPLAQLIQLF